MGNAYKILIKLYVKLHIFPIDPSMGRLEFVRASKFKKALAQLASKDFGQNFTPASTGQRSLQLSIG